MRNTYVILATMAAALLGGCSSSSTSPAPVGPTNPASGALATATINGGPAFINAAQHAVYISDGDTVANKSNCTGQCAAIWPPVQATGTLTAPWAKFTRSDGTQQLSYKGKPLYTFVNDTAPLVANGDGVNGFHLARP